MKKIRWGILSTAKIGREKVIPAMQHSRQGEVIAIASSNAQRLKQVASAHSIPFVYSSYEELLQDGNIDAVYIPLPNHMHVHWTLKAMEAGKHVLCEKPVGLSAAEAEQLVEASARRPHLKVMEAFMYRFHPQWIKAKALVAEGRIGALRDVQSFFSYNNTDPNNIRNIKEAGGGALMDIGCYCISFARFLYGKEPTRIFGAVAYDPTFQTDRLSSGILQFDEGISTFTCATQLMPYQRVNIMGSEGRIEVEVPVNAPPDKAMRILLHTPSGTEEFNFDAVDQYVLQADAFAEAILYDREVPTPLSDALNNMKAIEAVLESARTQRWIANAGT